MRIRYDSEVDALYIEFKTLEPKTAENREFSADVTANYGPDGKLAGLEILNASLVFGEELLNKIVVEATPTVHAVTA